MEVSKEERRCILEERRGAVLDFTAGRIYEITRIERLGQPGGGALPQVNNIDPISND
jgi:hypothetical protein